jgi:hypothetical protein
VKELTGVWETAIIYEDNLGALFLVKNQQVSSRTKHIDIRHHFMRELQDKKAIDVRFKRSEDNSSDIMTKNATRDIHEKHTNKIINGTLDFWKEDVKQDKSVNEFHKSELPNISLLEIKETRIPNTTSPVVQYKSRSSKLPHVGMNYDRTSSNWRIIHKYKNKHQNMHHIKCQNNCQNKPRWQNENQNTSDRNMEISYQCWY